MKKLNKKQKDHIKNILKKTFNIFCYICTGILAIILLIVCLQGCQNKPQKVSAESFNTNNRYHYTLINDGEDGTYIDLKKQELLLSYYNLPSTNLQDVVSVGTYQAFNVQVDINTQVLYLNDYEYVTSFDYRFRVCGKTGSSEVYWRINDINANLKDGSIRSVLEKVNNQYDDYNYDVFDSAIIYVSDLSFINVGGNQYLFDYYELSSFTFNKDFNFNAPLGTNINGLYGGAVFDGGSEVIKYINFDVGYFVSNGQRFNRIQYSCTTSDGTYALVRTSTSSTGNVTQLPTGYWVYQFMYYVNTDTNTYKLVNTHNSEPFTQSGSSGVSRYFTNDTTWEIDSYRFIQFEGFLTEANIDKLNRFNNNNQSGTSGYVVSGDVNNIFTLIASAFTGILPILTTYILPGITIGTLLFIPLVALLVFAIIRIIKK